MYALTISNELLQNVCITKSKKFKKLDAVKKLRQKNYQKKMKEEGIYGSVN